MTRRVKYPVFCCFLQDIIKWNAVLALRQWNQREQDKTSAGRSHGSSLFKHRHSLVFTTLGAEDKCLLRAGERGLNKKWNCACQSICMSLPVSGRAANQNNLCFSALEGGWGCPNSREAFLWRNSSYHSHHLQVLHIRPLCGQQLLGDEVGSIRGKPLESNKTKTRKSSSVNLQKIWR